MKNNLLLVMFVYLGTVAAFAQKAILIEDTKPISTSEYSSTLEMRAKRRVGIGFSLAGKLGMIGVSTELNFSFENSAIIGFGGGPKYSAFLAEWKKVFESRSFSPYTTFGYARWSGGGTSGALDQSTPSFFAQKFLTDSEKETGKFAKDLLTPSLGLQYNVLDGKNAGMSFYGEITELIEIISLTNLKTATIGGLGMLYYF